MVRSYLDRPALRKLANERSREIMRPASQRLRRERIKYEIHIAHGDIAPTIVRAARRLGCGTIVMGTRGHGPIATFVLGSIAHGVVHLSNVPVMLVK